MSRPKQCHEATVIKRPLCPKRDILGPRNRTKFAGLRIAVKLSLYMQMVLDPPPSELTGSEFAVRVECND